MEHAKPQPGVSLTIGEKYEPAMEVTIQGEADEYFAPCVNQPMSYGADRAEAERDERINLGYFAGYYDTVMRERIERLFVWAHSVFGTIEHYDAPSAAEALLAGAVSAKSELDVAAKLARAAARADW
jgi:hypothetical protein